MTSGGSGAATATGEDDGSCHWPVIPVGIPEAALAASLATARKLLDHMAIAFAADGVLVSAGLLGEDGDGLLGGDLPP